jgi:hypothetical protein
MKKIKKVFPLIIAFIAINPEIIFAIKYVSCGNDRRLPLALANIVSTFITIIKVAVPILLVIGGMISFFKATMSSNVEEDLKKSKNKLVNSIIAAVVIFFVISIINFAVSLVGGKNNTIMNCVNCLMNPDKCPLENESGGNKICPGFVKDQTRYDEDCNLIEVDETAKTKNTKTKNPFNNNSESDNNSNTNNNSGTNSGYSSFDEFLFIGDSRYNGISNELKSFGNNITVSAVDGKSAIDWLNNNAEDYALPETATGISVMLGVNNTNEENMKTLLYKLHRKYPNSIIYINSVYHVGSAYRGPATNEGIDQYNGKMQKIASQEEWIKYIDVTNELYDNYGFIKSEYTYDGLHLNENGKPVLVQNIKTKLSE